MPANMSSRPRARLPAAASLLVFGLMLAGCGKKPAPPPPPPQVGVVTLHSQAVQRTTDLPGRTSSVMIAQIIPQVSGVILKRLFIEGGDVEAGQQLYQIDPAPYQATYDNAVATLKRYQAQLTADRAQATRYKPLAAAQAVSQQDYDNAVAAVGEDEAEIASAKAQIESARINLQYTKVYSPISGTIGASSVTPGALVTAYQTTPLATVTTLDPIYVDVNESTTDWLRLKQEAAAGRLVLAPDGSAKVTLTLEDGSTYPLDGRMQFAEVNVDQTTGTVMVRALFPNPQHLLLPGMYVHAKLDEGTDKAAILVPQQAVSRNTHGDPVVLLVNEQNVVSQVVIQTGQNVGNYWLATSGLKDGDRVVVDGQQNATVGKAVTPVDETAQFAANPAA